MLVDRVVTVHAVDDHGTIVQFRGRDRFGAPVTFNWDHRMAQHFLDDHPDLILPFQVSWDGSEHVRLIADNA